MDSDHPDDFMKASDAELGDLSGLLQDADLGTDPQGLELTMAIARRFEDQFIAAFEQGWQDIAMLPHPREGTVYDVTPEREFVRRWDDRSEARRQLMREGRGSEFDHMPLCRGIQYSIVRKPLFGSPSPRVSVVAVCWSPLDVLARGAASAEEHAADLDVIDAVLERLLVAERPDVFHFIALCSTTGWDPLLRDPLPSGRNYLTALLEPHPPGWLSDFPKGWPPALRRAVEPEDEAARKQRVLQALHVAGDLEMPGGLMLVEELAESAVVPHAVAFEALKDFVEVNREYVLERVEGSEIIRRKR